MNCTSLEAKFEIERSGDGIHFGKIGSLSADALRCNQPFDFTDVQPVPGVNYYRLKIIDVDGKFAYSNTVSLTERNKNFNLLSINPNPVGKENAKLQINAGDKNDLILVIADFSGRVIIRQQAAIQQGINTIEILTSGLVAGTYQLSAISTEEKSQTIRFMKL